MDSRPAGNFAGSSFGIDPDHAIHIHFYSLPQRFSANSLCRAGRELAGPPQGFFCRRQGVFETSQRIFHSVAARVRRGVHGSHGSTRRAHTVAPTWALRVGGAPQIATPWPPLPTLRADAFSLRTGKVTGNFQFFLLTPQTAGVRESRPPAARVTQPGPASPSALPLCRRHARAPSGRAALKEYLSLKPFPSARLPS